MSEMSMIERVARAIYGVTWSRDDVELVFRLETHDYHEAMAQARAAIEAMREPTEAMVQRGAKELVEEDEWNRLGDVPREFFRDDSRAAYEAMIDEALR